MPTDWVLSMVLTIQTLSDNNGYCEILRVSTGVKDRANLEDRIILFVINNQKKELQTFSARHNKPTGDVAIKRVSEGQTYQIDATRTYEGSSADPNKWRYILKANGTVLRNQVDVNLLQHNDVKVFTSWTRYGPCDVKIKYISFKEFTAGIYLYLI